MLHEVVVFYLVTFGVACFGTLAVLGKIRALRTSVKQFEVVYLFY